MSAIIRTPEHNMDQIEQITVPRSERRSARREQLLDVVATMLLTKGLTRFTMESLAEQAGVSKALPYQHFENATDAIAALYDREIGYVASSINHATQGAANGADMLTAAVHAYFDAVDARGPVLTQLAGTGSPVPTMLFGAFPPAPRFLVELVERHFDVDPSTANLLASIASSIAIAASDGVARGDGDRPTIEAIASRAVVAAVTAALPPQQPEPGRARHANQ